MSNDNAVSVGGQATLEDLVFNMRQAIENPAWRAPDGAMDTDSGWCARAIRKVVQKTCGSKYDKAVVAPNKREASAVHMAHRFLALGLAWKWDGRPLQIGDIVFKTQGSGGFGHVGMDVGVGGTNDVNDDIIGENSSTGIGRIRGALGYRTFGQFKNPGGVQVVARLPLPRKGQVAGTGAGSGATPPQRIVVPSVAEPKLVIVRSVNGELTRTLIASSKLSGGHFSARASELAAALALGEGDVQVADWMAKMGYKAYHQNDFLKEKARFEIYV